MKRSLFIFIILISRFSFAQTTNVKGTVTESNGKPIPFVFIKDQDRHATFTSQNGTFSFMANANSKITATASNYNVATVKIDNSQNIKITLQANGVATPVITYSTDAFKENISTEGMTRNKGSQYIATEKGLHGSRYLFDNWVNGYFITLYDSVTRNNNYRFNYAKTDGTLMYTDDGKSVKQYDERQIKMFLLFTDGGKAYTFESVPSINTNHFVQVLALGNKYKIYKQILTRFKAADYVSNGMTSTGTTYDEFVDEITYYVIQTGGTPQKFNLKKKSLKEAFAADQDKLNGFMAAHSDDEINDQFLQQLGDELNK